MMTDHVQAKSADMQGNITYDVPNGEVAETAGGGETCAISELRLYAGVTGGIPPAPSRLHTEGMNHFFCLDTGLVEDKSRQ